MDLSPATRRAAPAPGLSVIGVRARKGGAVVVGVTLVETAPRVVYSAELETCDPGDPLSLAPYGVATAMPRDAQGRTSDAAMAAVAEGRRRQDQFAARGLQGVIAAMDAAGCRPSVMALLVNRAGWITDLLEYSQAWREHVPVAEALAVRDALRHGASRCALELVEMDEKSLVDQAVALFGVSAADLADRLKSLGAHVGRPWRKEQKLACLSAWLALAQG